jgi:hypothetical protein
MIAKGTTHDNGGRLASYMMRGKPGESAELWQLRGFASDQIKDAFRSIHVIARATRCEQPLFHVQVRNPAGEHLTRMQWEHVADRIELQLDLNQQPRAIAFHRDTRSGDEHMHVGWSRIVDGDKMRAKPLPFFKLRLKQVSRDLEVELGLTRVTNQRRSLMMAPKRHEEEQARRLGVNVREVHVTIRECWDRSIDGRGFSAALSAEDIILAQGERRDFIALDHEGGLHALGKRLLGNTAAEIRERTRDLDRKNLPTLDQARAGIALRREVPVPPTVSIGTNFNTDRTRGVTKPAARWKVRRKLVPSLTAAAAQIEMPGAVAIQPSATVVNLATAKPPTILDVAPNLISAGPVVQSQGRSNDEDSGNEVLSAGSGCVAQADDLRRRQLRKTFVGQFRLIAMRVGSALVTGRDRVIDLPRIFLQAFQQMARRVMPRASSSACKRSPLPNRISETETRRLKI